MNKQIEVINKSNLIKKIAKQTSKTQHEVREFYNALEKNIFNILYSANEESDVCIRLFEGINLDGKFMPEKNKKNNLTGETHFVSSKIKPKFYITRTYREKLNEKIN